VDYDSYLYNFESLWLDPVPMRSGEFRFFATPEHFTRVSAMEVIDILRDHPFPPTRYARNEFDPLGYYTFPRAQSESEFFFRLVCSLSIPQLRSKMRRDPAEMIFVDSQSRLQFISYLWLDPVPTSRGEFRFLTTSEYFTRSEVLEVAELISSHPFPPTRYAREEFELIPEGRLPFRGELELFSLT